MSDRDVEGRLSEDDVSPEVAEAISEAKDAHKEQAADPGATEGQGVEPAAMGHAEPDTGMGEAAESEVPAGVDSLTDEQIQAAEQRGGGDADDGGAVDMADVVAEGGADEDDDATG